MTLDEILDSLFPAGHVIARHADHLFLGTGKRADGGTVEVIGITDGEALGITGILPLADRVLDIIAAGGTAPILVVVDTQGQLMSRHDEMLGLNEYLAHLAKCLLLASRSGHPTVGLNYGKAVKSRAARRLRQRVVIAGAGRPVPKCPAHPRAPPWPCPG